MKEKFLNVLKILLIIFGIIFLFQIILFVILFTGLFSFANFNSDFDKIDINLNQTTKNKPKAMMPIIDYAEKYRSENGKYPQKIENVKTAKNLDYTYESTKDGNCYTITINEKKNTKTKQYQSCKTSSDNSSSVSESFVEYSK